VVTVAAHKAVRLQVQVITELQILVVVQVALV
jgi:hypothetical protein